MRPSHTWMAAAAFLFLLSAPPASSQEERNAVVISSASVRGETISCGCKAKDIGGLARRATIVGKERAKSESVLLVDCGDFGDDKDFQPWLRTEFLWEMMRKQGYDVVTPGPNEMREGTQKLLELFATGPEIQVVSANITDQNDNLLWQDHILIEKGDVVYGVTGVTDGAYYKYNLARGKQTTDDFSFRDVKTSLDAVIPQLKEKADLVVVLMHMSAGDAKRLVKELPGIDVGVAGHNPSYSFTPDRVGETLLILGGTRGQYVSVLRVNLDEKGRVMDYSGESKPLGDGVREDEEFKVLVTQFNESFEALQAEAKGEEGSK